MQDAAYIVGVWTHEPTHAGGVVPSSEVVEAGFSVAFFAGELVGGPASSTLRRSRNHSSS